MITFRSNSNFYVNARKIIQGSEGFFPNIYADSSGFPTLGYGYAFIIKKKDKNGKIIYDFNNKTIVDDFATINITWGESESEKLRDIQVDLNAGRISDAKTKTTELDALVQDIVIVVAGTTELLALADMVYNGGAGLVGRKLITAIWNGNRAEAWFEIRYNSNRLGWAQINDTDQGSDSIAIKEGEDKGLAKRRFLEAEVFGLYNDANNVSPDEAKQVYRMYGLHREEILKYEGHYGQASDGTPGSRDDMITQANNDYQLVGTERVDTLVESLDHAESALIAWLNGQHPNLNLNPGSYRSTDIYLDPGVDAGQSFTEFDAYHRATLDATLDEDGAQKNRNNLLIGEGGNDVLKGSLGDDVLYGGKGDDTYKFAPGDGADILVDEDGKGRIFIGDKELREATHQQGDPDNVYKTLDGHRLTLSGDTLTIAVKDDGGTITIQEFTSHPDRLGLKLNQDAPAYNVSSVFQAVFDYVGKRALGLLEYVIPTAHAAPNQINATPDHSQGNRMKQLIQTKP